MNKKILAPVLLMSTLIVLIPGQLLADNSTSLPNPIGGPDTDILTVLLRIMQVALMSVDIFALFMFILGGFQFLISAGNPNMVKRAKDTLVWATIGILVITMSYTIMKFIFEGISGKI